MSAVALGAGTVWPKVPTDRPVDVNLRAAQEGDAAAFDALIGPLVEPGYRLAVSILGDAHEAEDAVQEATIKAWRHLPGLKQGASVRAWFLTIIANHCRSVRRGRWWQTTRVADPVIAREGPEDSALQHADLTRALGRLDPGDRQALFLRYYLDLPMPEVAEVLGISETAAKSRIHRAVQRMRPGLEVPEDLR